MKKLLILSLLIIFSVNVEAGPLREVSNVQQLGNLLSAVSGTAAEASRTITQKVKGFVKIAQVISWTKSTGDTITVTCYGSNDGTTYGQLTTRSITSGASTVSPWVDTISFTASGAYALPLDTWGYDWMKCIYTINGGAGDNITVNWNLAVRK